MVNNHRATALVVVFQTPISAIFMLCLSPIIHNITLMQMLFLLDV